MTVNSICQSFFFWATFFEIQRVKMQRDVRYAGSDRHLLDVYPATGAPKGTVICVHGGGWMFASKDCAAEVSQILSERGYCVVTPSYRLSPVCGQVAIPTLQVAVVASLLTIPKKGAHAVAVWLLIAVTLVVMVNAAQCTAEWQHPAQVKDLALVLAWTRANIAQLGGDVGRVCLLGHSAGGHLACLLANNKTYTRALGLPDNAVARVVSLSGVYSDVLLAKTIAGAAVLRTVFGRGPYADAFPIHHCHATSPPHLLVAAELDYTLKAHATGFLAALRARGVRVTYHMAMGESHFTVCQNWRTTNGEILTAVDEFLS
jgi:acetyl esterase/lipase